MAPPRTKMISAFKPCFSKKPTSLATHTDAYVGEKLAYPITTLLLWASALPSKTHEELNNHKKAFVFHVTQDPFTLVHLRHYIFLEIPNPREIEYLIVLSNVNDA